LLNTSRKEAWHLGHSKSPISSCIRFPDLSGRPAIFQDFFAGVCVGEANDNPLLNGPLDERKGSFPLGGKGDQADSAPAGLPKSFHFLPIRQPDEILWMGSAKSFLG
jgi:hypothetical protein